MNAKAQLNRWTKLCLRETNTPICLISVDANGFPHVYTQHDKKTINTVLKHLVDKGTIDEKTHFDNLEN